MARIFGGSLRQFEVKRIRCCFLCLHEILRWSRIMAVVACRVILIEAGGERSRRDEDIRKRGRRLGIREIEVGRWVGRLFSRWTQRLRFWGLWLKRDEGRDCRERKRRRSRKEDIRAQRKGGTRLGEGKNWIVMVVAEAKWREGLKWEGKRKKSMHSRLENAPCVPTQFLDRKKKETHKKIKEKSRKTQTNHDTACQQRERWPLSILNDALPKHQERKFVDSSDRKKKKEINRRGKSRMKKQMRADTRQRKNDARREYLRKIPLWTWKLATESCLILLFWSPKHWAGSVDWVHAFSCFSRSCFCPGFGSFVLLLPSLPFAKLSGPPCCKLLTRLRTKEWAAECTARDTETSEGRQEADWSKREGQEQLPQRSMAANEESLQRLSFFRTVSQSPLLSCLSLSNIRAGSQWMRHWQQCRRLQVKDWLCYPRSFRCPRLPRLPSVGFSALPITLRWSASHGFWLLSHLSVSSSRLLLLSILCNVKKHVGALATNPPFFLCLRLFSCFFFFFFFFCCCCCCCCCCFAFCFLLDFHSWLCISLIGRFRVSWQESQHFEICFRILVFLLWAIFHLFELHFAFLRPLLLHYHVEDDDHQLERTAAKATIQHSHWKSVVLEGCQVCYSFRLFLLAVFAAGCIARDQKHEAR